MNSNMKIMIEKIKSHLPILICLTLINIAVLIRFISDEKTIHGIGYFVFFYVSMLTVELFTRKVIPQTEIVVKNPKREFFAIVLFSCLGFIMLSINFILKSGGEPIKPVVRIPALIFMFLFSFPLAALIYLLVKKYKLQQLGLKTKPITLLILGFIICGITGLISYIFNNEGMLWQKVIEESGGIVGVLFYGVIGAALAEEFSRFVIQSRFEKLFHSKGFHILFATVIWALMHFPVIFWKQETPLIGTLLSCVKIIPLGFVWGYMTHRTKTILPAVIAHGLNFWGLQNG